MRGGGEGRARGETQPSPMYDNPVWHWMVSVTGLEPVQYRYREILSLLCLPFHHTDIYSPGEPGRIIVQIVLATTQPGGSPNVNINARQTFDPGFCKALTIKI